MPSEKARWFRVASWLVSFQNVDPKITTWACRVYVSSIIPFLALKYHSSLPVVLELAFSLEIASLDNVDMSEIYPVSSCFRHKCTMLDTTPLAFCDSMSFLIGLTSRAEK